MKKGRGREILVHSYFLSLFPCILPDALSYRPQHSGETSCSNGAGRNAAGDLSAQSINRAQIPLSSIRHAAPLEMTTERAALQSWGEKTNDVDTILPHMSFRPQRSEVEKSHAGLGRAAMMQEISRLRVSIERRGLYFHVDMQLRSR